MRRWLYNFAAAILLMFCIASVIFWIRSHGRPDSTEFHIASSKTVKIRSDNGGLAFSVNKYDLDPVMAAAYHDLAPSVSFGRGRIHFVETANVEFDSGAHGSIKSRFVIVPYWMLVICFFVLPAIWFRRFCMERFAPKSGACRKCGYDFTGNQSGVCPECGTPTALASTDSGLPR